jgi:fucose permease
MQSVQNSRSDLRTIIVSYLGFIGLGMTGGLLGLAWPTMQKEFEVPLDAVGILLLAGTLGYLSASFLSGPIAYRFGAGKMFIGSAVLSAFGLLATSLTHTWLLLPVFLVIGGFGNGLIDAGFNAYVAQHHGARAMNWLHGSFGIGTTIGPLVMRQVLISGESWRVGYTIASGVMLAVAVIFMFGRTWWKPVIVESETANTQRKSVRDVLRMPAVWFGIGLFFLYAGLEATPGTWVYTLFTQARGIDPSSAGAWVSIYWGSFTVGRFFFGAIITRVNTLTLTRFCMIGVLVGAFLLWWNPAAWIGFVGLTVVGFMEAPLFPIFVSDTPKRVGMENAGNAIGFQVAGAGIGIALLPAFAGVLANNSSLNVIPLYIFVAAVVVIVLHEFSVAQGKRINERAVAPSAGD